MVTVRRSRGRAGCLWSLSRFGGWGEAALIGPAPYTGTEIAKKKEQYRVVASKQHHRSLTLIFSRA
jgi:hypothetical protein